MIILDTDVLSEAMRDTPDSRFMVWFNAESRLQIWTAAISLLEIRFGIERLPAGRRRTALATALARPSVTTWKEGSSLLMRTRRLRLRY